MFILYLEIGMLLIINRIFNAVTRCHQVLNSREFTWDTWELGNSSLLGTTNNQLNLSNKQSKELHSRGFQLLAVLSVQFSSVQSLSRVRLCATPWIAARQASLSITISWSSFRLTFIEPSHSRSSPSPPAPNPSQHQSLFQWVSSLQEVAKVLELQL